MKPNEIVCLKLKQFGASLPLLMMVLVGVTYSGTVVADKNQCREGRVCAWKHENYRGCFDDDLFWPDSDWSNGSPTFDDCRWSKNMNDEVTSYWNRSTKWVIFYQHAHGKGTALCVAPGASSLNVGRRLNDTFSSHTAIRGRPQARWCTLWDWR